MNPYRPWSGLRRSTSTGRFRPSCARRLKLPRFLLNPNLGQETTAEEYLAGLEDGLAMLLAGVLGGGGRRPLRRCWRGRGHKFAPAHPHHHPYPFRNGAGLNKEEMLCRKSLSARRAARAAVTAQVLSQRHSGCRDGGQFQGLLLCHGGPSRNCIGCAIWYRMPLTRPSKSTSKEERTWRAGNS